MIRGRASQTAQGTALVRAAHQLVDRPPVFDDPLALKIVGAAAEQSLKMHGARLRDRFPARAILAARSRFAEDELARAVGAGVRQYVVLGAGLDTFAFRNSFELQGLRVFEVDHPDTQLWKKERLREVGIALPGSLAFAPVDFERQTLGEGLAAAGFDAREPAFFSILGVMVFLTEQAGMELMRWMGERPVPTAFVMDYGVKDGLLSAERRAARERWAKQSESIGEKFQTFFDPAELVVALRGMGFGDVEDLGAQEINARYFAGRADGLCVEPESRRLLRATRA